MNKKIFEEKIQPLLQYIGAIGAGIMSVAYIVITFILVNGFEYHQTTQTFVFALVNAVVGFIIMQFLKIQGESFAQHLPENETIIKEYYNTETKDKKVHSIKFYWITSILKDVFSKCLGLAFTTFGLIYIVIQGSNDYQLIWLAIVNLMMFICFGLLSLNGAYNYYNNKHVPYMLKQLELIKENKKCQELKSETTPSETSKTKSDILQQPSNQES